MKYNISSEDNEQIRVLQWAEWSVKRYPELKWLHHCPNGGSRNVIEATKLKRMGVKAGVSDLILPYPKGIYCGLYVELKYGNNKTQDTQIEFLRDMEESGHFVATCYSAEEAIEIIEDYCRLYTIWTPDAIEEYLKNVIKKPKAMKQAVMKIPNNSILKKGKVTPQQNDLS